MNDTTERRLTVLLDKEEIRDVLLRFCRGLDRCDAELIGSAFHPDADIDFGNMRMTGSEVGTKLSEALKAQFRATQHYLMNHYIEIDGDVARSETYFLAQHLSDEQGANGPLVVVHDTIGRYVHRFERREAVWKIARRVTVRSWERVDRIGEWPTRPGEPALRSRGDLCYQREF